MGFDWTITIGNVVTLLAVAMAGIGAWYAQKYQVQAATEKADSAKKEAEAAMLRARTVEASLQEYRTEVVEKYATHKSLEQLEGRIIQAVERIGDRLDRVFERTTQNRSPRRSTD